MAGKTWTYTYNAEGMRTKRVSGNEAYTYYYNGDLLRYLDYDSNTADSSQAAKLYFVLDANGNPIEVSCRPEGSTTTKFYYYVQNLQGDVIALVDSANGNTVVTYTYDAWGNVLSTNGSLATTLGVLNPFRYRGYVYDSETALYFCQSRYYDPALGRFINADAFASTGQGILGNNMFAYCGNNPVAHTDPNGYCSCAIGQTRSGVAYTGICPVCGSCGGGAGGGGIVIDPGKVGAWILEGAAKVATYGFQTVVFSSTTASAYAQDTSQLTLAGREPPDGQYQYWEAYRINKIVYVGKGISLEVARLRVAYDLNVMCRDENAARLLIAKYDAFIGPEKDRGKETNPNYFWHFHVSRDSKAHIWYFEGA